MDTADQIQQTQARIQSRPTSTPCPHCGYPMRHGEIKHGICADCASYANQREEDANNAEQHRRTNGENTPC